MATDLIVNLNAGQLASMIGIINTLLPIIISLIGAAAILMRINDEMTALEWTTISKLTEHSLLNFYGTGGQPALTGIKLWGVGPYNRNILYFFVGLCPEMLFGASVIAPLGIKSCKVTNTTLPRKKFRTTR